MSGEAPAWPGQPSKSDAADPEGNESDQPRLEGRTTAGGAQFSWLPPRIFHAGAAPAETGALRPESIIVNRGSSTLGLQCCSLPRQAAPQVRLPAGADGAASMRSWESTSMHVGECPAQGRAVCMAPAGRLHGLPPRSQRCSCPLGEVRSSIGVLYIRAAPPSRSQARRRRCRQAGSPLPLPTLRVAGCCCSSSRRQASACSRC